jgi:hypothetical protein
MERIAWRSAMQSERVVVCEKGAVAKKAVFPLTNIVNRKRAFNIDRQQRHLANQGDRRCHEESSGAKRKEQECIMLAAGGLKPVAPGWGRSEEERDP